MTRRKSRKNPPKPRLRVYNPNPLEVLRPLFPKDGPVASLYWQEAENSEGDAEGATIFWFDYPPKIGTLRTFTSEQKAVLKEVRDDVTSERNRTDYAWDLTAIWFYLEDDKKKGEILVRAEWSSRIDDFYECGKRRR